MEGLPVRDPRAADSKPCPKCSTVIYKIDGCDQMWCVKCHTAFSWRTGRIETRIHNPHYFEWMREHKQSLARNPEDGCLDLDTQFRHYFMGAYPGSIHNMKIHKLVRDFQRFRIHVNEAEMIRFRFGDNEFDNTLLRLKFLLGEVSEEKFKTQTYKRKKTHEKKKHMCEFLTLFFQISEDIVKNAVQIYINNIYQKNIDEQLRIEYWGKIGRETKNNIQNVFNK